jgi:hypothetical protein
MTLKIINNANVLAADTIAFTEGGAEAMRINSDAQTVHTLGTALLPSMTFTGDVNTGIFSPTADVTGFTQGGGEAMRINSSAGSTQVLVGTTTTNGNINAGKVFGYMGTVIKFRTFSATNTFETLETLPSNYGQILVCARGSGGGNATNDDAIAFFCINNSSTSQSNIKTASNVEIRMNGLDLQAKQQFFPSANISYSILRLNN